MTKKPLKIDMIAGSQLRDTQGEMLSVEGADISELEAGRGRINDNHGKGFFNAIGRIINAKKIFKKDDCESARHEYYWDKVKAPYIYVEAELFDDEDHPNARAAAAILRNIHKADTPLQLKASVEGGVIARGIADQSLLARTKIHSVALTFTPANNNTLVEPTSLIKSDIDEVTDMLLIKSVMHLAETNIPSFRHIARDASATKVQNNLTKLVDLMKELGIEGEITIPSKSAILEKAIEQKIENNVSKIHELMTKLRQEDNLEKDFKSGVKAGLLGTALAISPAQAKNSHPAITGAALGATTGTKQAMRQPKTHQEVFNEVSKQYPLLGAIGQIESCGATCFDHATLKNGKFKGQKAGGMFGMEPYHASFILSKDKELAKKYPHLVEASKDLSNKHNLFTEEFNKNPQAAADFAISGYKRNKLKTKSDQMLIYSWLNGLKGSWNAYKKGGQNAIENHPYVKKVMAEHMKRLQKDQQNQPLKVPFKKALMAGYGGAGAPSSHVGGAVVQTESLDSKPGFKYFSCDNCGKEQVHAKHQVKCRECGHSISFEKLYNAIRGNK
jgi:hypothetical protein